MQRIDLVLAAGIIGLSAWAVAAQLGSDPVGMAAESPPPRTLEIGEALEDQNVRGMPGQTFRLHALMGQKATVFYSWSTACKCVKDVDLRLDPRIEEWKQKGVSFIAVAGDPKDTADVVHTWMAQWMPRYKLVLDPAQRLCAQLGFKEAVHFVVVDADGYLRFRGTFDDDLKKPTTGYLLPALESVVAGRLPEHPVRFVPDYGCPFGKPGKDCEPEAAGKP